MYELFPDQIGSIADAPGHDLEERVLNVYMQQCEHHPN